MQDTNHDRMAWNSPGSGGSGPRRPQDSGPEEHGSADDADRGGPEYDPWGRRRARGFDADALLRMLRRALGGPGGGEHRQGLSALTVLGVTLLGIYIFSGFYTVREAERGVLLRFGKVSDIVEPGLAWKFTGIDTVDIVDIEQVRAIQSSGSMLTEDENVVIVEMDVQYRISDPVQYLFSVTDPDNSLLEATDSALRYVVGHTLMDDILTSGREMVRQNTRELLVSVIEPYNMGLTIVDVNFLPARAPEQVKAAFDDAIAAQEDEQRFKREAEAYANEVLPKADGQVQRISQEAEAYRSQVVLKAQGEVARFEKILPEYTRAPDITRRRIYLETMQEVLASATKVIVDTGEGQAPLLYLPMPQGLTLPRTAVAAAGGEGSEVRAESESSYPAQNYAPQPAAPQSFGGSGRGGGRYAERGVR